MLRVLYLNERRAEPDFDQPQLDALYHDYWARAMVTHDWSPPADVNDPEIRTRPYVRTPLYPFFLAGCYKVFGMDPLWPRVAQMALGLLNVVMMFALGRRCFGDFVGVASAAACSFYWVLIYYEGELVESVLVIFLVLAFLHASKAWLDRPGSWWAWIVGLALGVLALARPNALLLAPCMLLWGWWWLRKQKRPSRGLLLGLAFVLGCAMAVAPVTARNYLASGEFVLITSGGGLNLYIGNNESSDGYSGVLPGAGGWTSFDHPALVRQLSAEMGRNLNYSQAAREWGRRGWSYIRRNPGRVMRLAWRKALLFWGPQEVSVEKEDELVRSNSRVLHSIPGSFAAVFTLALSGLFLFVLDTRRSAQPRLTRGGPKQTAILVLCATFALVWFLSHVPFTVTGRYRVAVLPPLFLMGAYGLVRGAELLRARNTREAAIFLMSLFVVYLLASVDFAGYSPNEAKWHLTRGIAYGRSGDPVRAEVELSEAAKLDEFERHAGGMPPAPTQAAQIYNSLGVSLAIRGRINEARLLFERALEYDDGLVEAHKNLGRALSVSEEVEAALAQFMRAAEIRPNDNEAHAEAGYLLLRMERPAEAAAEFHRALDAVPGCPRALEGLKLAGQRH